MSQPTSEKRLAMREYPNDTVAIMDQKWRHLLFLHWEYDADAIQTILPSGLHVDTFDGKAYVSITPFFLEDVKIKMMPALPGVSDFLEMNVRTYVYDDNGIPGVWFFSLDANNLLAVQTARTFFHLPYKYAEMEGVVSPENEVYFRCQRAENPHNLEYIYQPQQGEPTHAQPETLDFFLIERYVLFADRGDNAISMGRIHHAPYPLSQVDVRKWNDIIFEMDGLEAPQRAPDLAHYSKGVDVDIFHLQAVKAKTK